MAHSVFGIVRMGLEAVGNTTEAVATSARTISRGVCHKRTQEVLAQGFALIVEGSLALQQEGINVMSSAQQRRIARMTSDLLKD